MKTIHIIVTRPLSVFLCMLLFLPPQFVFAQPPVPSGATNTTIGSAGNGVPVVNIAAPSASGLSHNMFHQYDVDAGGLILNNGDKSQQFRNSQLGGQIAANQNLAVGHQAQIILNEVTGSQRSSLRGFTEVLGGKADLVVVNPFGITCNGAGFINTDRVSLVTGRPNVVGGSIVGFDINDNGDIFVTGSGINASAQQLLDLVSRKISINGQINGQTLNLAAGRGNWDYATGLATAMHAGDGRPTYGIDTSALGGMYAGRIIMASTEGSVGVRVLGNAAATADDFRISSDGKIEIGSNISAVRDLNLTTSNSDISAIAVSNSSLTAGRNLALSASSGGGTLIGGSIVAGEDLSYAFKHLSDTGNGSFDTSDTNKRYGANINFTGTGNWLFNGVSYSSGSDLSLVSGNLSLGATLATSLSADNNLSLRAPQIALANITLNAGDDLELTSTIGALNFSSAQTRLKSLTGNMRLTAASGLDNAVTLTADSGDVVIRANGAIVNSGTIHAGRALDIADYNGSSTETLTNSGNLFGETVAVKAFSLTHIGGDLESLGDMSLAVDGQFDNDVTSRILVATSGVGSGQISALHIDNLGILHSFWDLDISADISIRNDGGISALEDLSIATTTVIPTDREIKNYGAIYAGHYLNISGDFIFIDTSGTLDSDGDILSNSIHFINRGKINTTGDITITAQRFSNYLQIVAGKLNTLTIRGFSGGDNNATGLLSAGTVTLTGLSNTASFTNSGSIYATTFNATGFNLTNTTTLEQPTITPITETPSSFPGLSLSLPTNPHGRFIPSQNPNSNYLIESNPLYTNIDNFLGSDYLEEKYDLGIDNLVNNIDHLLDGGNLAEKYSRAIDKLVKRLGDAAYETYLVQQQIIAQSGDHLLTGYENEKEQMRGLMDHAGSQYKDLGLTYGTALTKAQQANLTDDMIWMVETVVDGQTVLAPVVYLAEKTQKLFTPAGAKITADNINMDLHSLTNSGGTISATNTIDVTTQGDIKNLGGTIKGKDVSLSSTSGNIVNKTQLKRVGNGTAIDKQAGIEAENTLNLTAKKNIINKGAQISAGGDASLTAGDNVVFDTVETTTYSGEKSSGGNIFVKTTKKNTKKATEQLKSGLTTGGNLTVKAKKDIVFAGTDVKSKGSVDLDAGGDLSLIAREKTQTERTETTKKGVLVGGGAYGEETETTEHYKSKNVGTTIQSGQDISLSSGKTVTVQGSDVSTDADIYISAEDVKVLAGKDVDRTSKEKSTTTFLNISLLGERSYDAKAKAEAEAGVEATAGGKSAKAEASADAKAEAEGKHVDAEDASIGIASKGKGKSEANAKADAGVENTTGFGVGAKEDVKANAEFNGDLDLIGLDIKKTTTVKSSDEKIGAVGSTLNGKNIKITARKKVTLEGAKVTSKGDLEISGQDVNIMAAEDKHTVSKSYTKERAGVFFSKDFKTKVDVADKHEVEVGSNSSKIGVEGKVSGGYGSTESTDFYRKKTGKVTTTDTTNVGSKLSSGGSIHINAGNKLKVQGSDVVGEGDVAIKAKDMEFLEGRDSHTKTTSSSDLRTGLYTGNDVHAKVEGDIKGSVNSGGVAGEVKAEADANVKVGAGGQVKHKLTGGTEKTTKARVSTITSKSGSVSRTAENSITDVGTKIEAAGDFNQTAESYTSKAAADTSSKTSYEVSNAAKVGIYGNASASANAEGEASAGGGGAWATGEAPSAKAQLTGGIDASYSGEANYEKETSSKAVVTSIKAGGKVKSVTSGKTQLEGTQIYSKQGVEIEAKSLDYQAAKNTKSKTSLNAKIDASAAAGIGVSATKVVAVDLELAGSVEGSAKEESTSTAVTGGITSEGDIRIKTQDDTRLEGTSLSSKGDTRVEAGGDLIFDAAHDTKQTRSAEGKVNAGFTTSKGKNELNIGANAGAETKLERSQSSDAKAGVIKTDGQLILSAGKSVDLEGTEIASKGDVTISGQEGVTLRAAKNTSSSESVEVKVDASISGGREVKDDETTKKGGVQGSFEGEYEKKKETTAVGSQVSSDGNLKIISGKDITTEGAELSAGNKVTIDAGGAVNLNAAESTSETLKVGLNFSGKTKSETKSPKAKKKGTGGTQGSDGSKKNDAALSDWQKKQDKVLKELQTKKETSSKDGKSKKSADKNKNKSKIGFEVKNEKSVSRKETLINAGSGGLEIKSGSK